MENVGVELFSGFDAVIGRIEDEGMSTLMKFIKKQLKEKCDSLIKGIKEDVQKLENTLIDQGTVTEIWEGVFEEALEYKEQSTVKSNLIKLMEEDNNSLKKELRGTANQLETLDDQTLPQGRKIGPSLLKAIEESHIVVIVFSENYADSSWCLQELAHIMKCKDERGLIVIPIFYHVDSSEVRKQKGKYGETLAKHESENKKR
ncbi:hypothetical protein OSB04_018716 [Centaurea solstitialis]|uniref:TIR domain-containing protein n=1 Tax=Centaurea solstitialis TaxID=347529 RepID=A0AA38TIK7_9ASTR|nr:hypothetical protein OSB04_018716 [Centaurea solstitialis]